ncbi:MAG: hypothetical protein APF77_11960 [Clostridia bacterium BRH_c25]|nr:MAG: hypothetical protein APF77_11960 [Clostridia bacterium BRH_c25]
MRKKIKVILIFFISISVMFGCAGKNDGVPAESAIREQNAPAAVEEALEEEIVEIKEKMFITQINDIYLNPDDYMGKKIKLEGFHTIVEVDGETVHGVIRNGPGCCGNDGVAGFEFVWDGEYPKDNDWLSVTGYLEIVNEDGIDYMHLNATELEVLAERGTEFVVN